MKEYEVNKIEIDEFGRPNGVLILAKPVGITSHDLVDETRKKYKTRAVGHAGTLDPFASGKMIVLVGKATKLSDSFLGMDKEYIADIALGISTHTGDVEGQIKSEDLKKISKEDVLKAINGFPKEYLQYVPVFSSVKIKGNKLRELARSSDKFEFIDNSDSNEVSKKIVKFYKNGKVVFESPLPAKVVKLYEFELLSFEEKDLNDYDNRISNRLIEELKVEGITKLPIAQVRVKCSKGTYIRQLAEDLGEKLGIPASLFALVRTKIGEY
ncbi:MAG: hypothetical protein ABIM99_02095 [Candidatus Dojkabacteria bacterium]